jgi:hypothetical protein
MSLSAFRNPLRDMPIFSRTRADATFSGLHVAVISDNPSSSMPKLSRDSAASVA